MDFPRLHFFEFEDLKWLPNRFRQYITDLLAHQMKFLGIYDSTVPKLEEVLTKTGHDTLVDLCSGSGGPAPSIRTKIAASMGKEIRLVLTDKYPNLEVFNSIQEPYIATITQSVDATKVLPELKGVRTMFTAFHHFKPEQARHILQDAIDAEMPIGIFEITERKPISLMTLIIAPITCLFFSLMIRPRKIGRFFWTYLVPVIPFLYTWDGLISNFRTYTRQEYLEMIDQLTGKKFRWEVGEVTSKFHIKVTYLIGYPESISDENCIKNA